jgi:hypothetical protein
MGGNGCCHNVCVKVTCPACSERQDDFGRTTFDCSGCGASLSTVRPAGATAAGADSAAVLDAPFGWPARVWLTFGTVTHLIGAIVLLVALTNHDDADTWAPNATGIVVGAIVSWLGFLLLIVGLTAYGTEVVTARPPAQATD